MVRKVSSLLMVLALLVVTAACSSGDGSKEVVIYVSVDQVYAEPILKEFEQKTGIRVLAVYDVEAAKTTGMVNRLLAEKENPKADVFWNGEFVQTLLLKEQGLLAANPSLQTEGIPDTYVDQDKQWAGFGGRARVLLVNKNRMRPEGYPKRIVDLNDSKYPGEQIGLAYPVFGTTATHAAALYSALGAEQAKGFFQGLRGKGVQVVDGNSVVRDMVVDGRLAMGLTDTDDAGAAVKKGAPVEMVFLDQGPGEMGTLMTPNTVAMIQKGPHPKEAAQLMNYLLSQEVENKLLASGWIDFSLRNPPPGKEQVQGMKVNLQQVYEQLAISKSQLQELFIR